MSLMGRDSEKVRCLAIKTIGCIMYEASHKTKTKFLNFHGYAHFKKPNGLLIRSCHEIWRQIWRSWFVSVLALTCPRYQCMTDVLKPFTFTEVTYRALIEVLVGTIHLKESQLRYTILNGRFRSHENLSFRRNFVKTKVSRFRFSFPDFFFVVVCWSYWVLQAHL